MESLIFSKPIPTKLYVLKSCLPPTLSLPRLNFAAARGRSGSCLHSSSASQTTTWKFDDANTHHHSSQPHPHFFTQLIQIISNRPKVITVTPSAIVLLSAFCLLFIHPLSAFATSFQTAAKSGGGGLLVHAEILNGAWTGFLAGCLHTLSGPDHLAALAPLSIGRTRMESAAVGALWGCGHDAGQLLFGLLFLLLKDRLSLHIGLLQTWGTRVVGFTLLVIGAMGIREAFENENGEFDVSLQGGFETAAAAIGKKSKVGFATFATGIVHGLQPDALMMVVPALALPSRFAGAAFLFMFLAGTVIAMGGYTAFLASCSQALKDRVPRITEKLTWASSLVAIALGFAILAGLHHQDPVSDPGLPGPTKACTLEDKDQPVKG
nr:chloroplast zebra-necrosis protein [Ipomoea batatas]GMC85321.1 chloroplast zebra-necrosis protein [Ipomoea batatas]